MRDYDSFRPKCVLNVYQLDTFVSLFSHIYACFQPVLSTFKKLVFLKVDTI